MKKQKRSNSKARVGNEYAKNPLVVAFAMRMKEWRQGEGLTLKTMSKDTGLSMAIICEWEHGNRFPSVDHLWALAQYTGIPAWELIRPAQVADKTKHRLR